MTLEDDRSLSEDDIDAIVEEVVDRLRESDVGDTDRYAEIEVREEDVADSSATDDGADRNATDDGADRSATDDGADPTEADGGATAGAGSGDADGSGGDDGERRAGRRGEGPAEELRQEADRVRRRAERRADRYDEFGERIEDVVATRLEGVADTLERALGASPPEPPEPPQGVVIGPGDTRSKAVYKTQLQKGGRIAVPDAEIEALGLEPGDTLQVVVYPVGAE